MNDYDLRCSWCDARLSDKQARIHHEQEEHGTVTDEQINRAMTEKGFWSNEYTGPAERVGEDLCSIGGKPYGPGLNVTVPRAEHPATCLCNYCMKAQAERLGLSAVVRDLEARHLPLPEDKMAQPGQCGEGLANAWPEGSMLGVEDEDAEWRSQSDAESILEINGTITAGDICQQAADITAGDRQKQNGDKLPNHENISALWSAYLGVPINAHQAATMMVLLKVARTKLGAFNTDDYVDMAGYAGCAAEIRHRSNQERE